MVGVGVVGESTDGAVRSDDGVFGRLTVGAGVLSFREDEEAFIFLVGVFFCEC